MNRKIIVEYYVEDCPIMAISLSSIKVVSVDTCKRCRYVGAKIDLTNEFVACKYDEEKIKNS